MEIRASVFRMGDDDELMEELAAAAVDEGLANTFKASRRGCEE